MNVAIAPAAASATSAITAPGSSGSSVSRNAPPETGGISATSSPVCEYPVVAAAYSWLTA